MKTKLRFGNLIKLLLICGIIFITSCAKEEVVVVPESDIPAGLSLKSAEEPAPDDMICDLIAGQNISAGKVAYSNDGDNLLVEYVATDGWMLSEVHFYIGNMDDFQETCMNKKAVKIGKFPYSESDIDDDSWSFSVPLDGIEPGPEGYLVVAHAVVKNGDQVETAFAKCDYFITTLKAKFVNDAGDEFFGESEGMPFIEYDPLYWCSNLGTNVYEGEDTYPIGSWGNYYGEVHVSDDGVNLMIDVTANSGLSLIGVWVYVGPLNGLQSYIDEQVYDGVCPKYWEFPISSFIKEASHSFSVPLPNSTSFEDAFEITRWGWISYYNPS